MSEHSPERIELLYANFDRLCARVDRLCDKVDKVASSVDTLANAVDSLCSAVAMPEPDADDGGGETFLSGRPVNG